MCRKIQLRQADEWKDKYTNGKHNHKLRERYKTIYCDFRKHGIQERSWNRLQAHKATRETLFYEIAT